MAHGSPSCLCIQKRISWCASSPFRQRGMEVVTTTWEAWAPPREEGVLVIDSGSATHNLSVHGLRSESVSWAYEFYTLLKEALFDGR